MQPSMPWLSRVLRRFSRLKGDERGNVLIYVTLGMAVIMGMTGLALDGSRAMITHHDAQAAADAAAQAAAAQLDASADAISRATAAATGASPLISNDRRFAEGAQDTPAVAITSIRFLTGLPNSDDTDPIPASFDTTDPSRSPPSSRRTPTASCWRSGPGPAPRSPAGPWRGSSSSTARFLP